MTYDPKLIQKRLVSMIRSRGLSSERVAKLAGVNYNTIIKLRCGQNTNPTLRTLIALSKALKQPVTYFFEK